MIERRRCLRPTCLAAALLFSASVVPGDSVESAVRDLFARLMDADNRGDLNAVVTCYSADAKLFPPDGTVVAGADEIRLRYARLFTANRMEVRITVAEIEVGDALAYVHGQTRGRIVPKDGSPTQAIADRYLTVLRKVPRSGWRIVALAWDPLPSSD